MAIIRNCSNDYDSLLGVIFKLCWCPTYPSISIFGSISVAQQAIVATTHPYCCLQYLSMDPKAELLCPAIAIDPQNCRPIVGPIGYSTGHYPRCKKELNGTQTGRSKTLQAWSSHRTHIHSDDHLVVETIHLKLLGHKKDRQLRIRGFSAGLEGRAAWMMNGELKLIVPRRAVFEGLRFSTLKQ